MGARGRKGSYELVLGGVVGETVSKDSRQAPKTLRKDGKALWKELMDAHPAGHFSSGDYPLLEVYCREFERYRNAAKQVDLEGEVIETSKGVVKRNPWHDVLVASANMLTQIAQKLRLCANSRLTQKQAGEAIAAESRAATSARSGLMFGSEEKVNLQ